MINLNSNFKMGVSLLVPKISIFFCKKIHSTSCLEAENIGSNLNIIFCGFLRNYL